MEVKILSLSYDPLWDMLKEKGINKMEFANAVDISNATLAKLGHNEAVSLTTIDKICNTFDCGIENVVKHITDITINDVPPSKLNSGTIIASFTPLSQHYKITFCTDYNGIRDFYYVIIAKVLDITDNVATYTYKFAPLSTLFATNDLNIIVPFFKLSDIYFYDVVVRLDLIEILPANSNFRIIGDVPKIVKNKIEKFNSFIKTL